MISLLAGKHTAGAVGTIKGPCQGCCRPPTQALPPEHQDRQDHQTQPLPHPPESRPPKTSVPRGLPLLAVPVEAGPRQRGREGSECYAFFGTTVAPEMPGSLCCLQFLAELVFVFQRHMWHLETSLCPKSPMVKAALPPDVL